MRTQGIMKYFYRRYTLGILIFLLAVFVISIITVLTSMSEAYTQVMEMNDGGATIVNVHSGLAAYSDPSRILPTFSVMGVAWIMALIISGKDRRFFVSMSVSRYEILIGSFMYLVTLTLALAVVGEILTVVGCTTMMLSGMTVRGGWTLQTILTGDNADWLKEQLINLTDTLAMIGLATFSGYMFRRWWKVILSVYGAFWLGSILVAMQLSDSMLMQMFLERMIDLAEYFRDVLAPTFEQYASETNIGIIAARNIGICIGFTVLSYPVMRGMKVS